MATVDKAAIGWTMGIVAVAIAIAGMGAGGGITTPSMPEMDVSMPSPTVVPEEPTPSDPFAEAAEKVKAQQMEREAAMEEQLAMVGEKESEPEPEAMESEMTTEPEAMESEVSVSEPRLEEAPAAMGPKTVVVDMPEGTSVPGCEETNECYIPASVTINVGDTVSWVNSDTAAHTVTSGTPADGPDGIFDSSLVMGGGTFEVTFDESGSYDYFCMVHPWMVVTVTVN